MTMRIRNNRSIFGLVVAVLYCCCCSSSDYHHAAAVDTNDPELGVFVIEENLELKDECVTDYDPNSGIVDYFPTKYEQPDIASYGDVDIYGNQFVPHNTTDFLQIEYFNTYKIVTNSHQDPPKKYLLYQCGTDIPQDVIDNTEGGFDLVTSVPHRGGLALTQTPQIPYVELLGLREEIIAYIGNPMYVSSPCMNYMMMDEASSENTIDVVYDTNYTLMEESIDEFRTKNPDAIIVSGPTNNVVGDRVIVASATQERTNVATFDWIAFYAAFYNLEGLSNRISSEKQTNYDCTNAVANTIVETKQQRMLDDNDEEEEYHTPTIFWANYFTWGGLGWSVAECPTWDTTYYCEYAAHCDATILTRPEGVGYNQTYGGSPTVYWYLNDTEAFEMGKDADIFIYSGSDWNALYESHGEMLDQFKSVQNKQVYDTLGQGPSTWNEQRYAEYDTVGLDMCDVVGHSSSSIEDNQPYKRRWFRNVYTEPIGSLDDSECDVNGGEIGQPLVTPTAECIVPAEQHDDDNHEEDADGSTSSHDHSDSDCHCDGDVAHCKDEADEAAYASECSAADESNEDEEESNSDDGSAGYYYFYGGIMNNVVAVGLVSLAMVVVW